MAVCLGLPNCLKHPSEEYLHVARSTCMYAGTKGVLGAHALAALALATGHPLNGLTSATLAHEWCQVTAALVLLRFCSDIEKQHAPPYIRASTTHIMCTDMGASRMNT